jgi:hypothetical protein
VNDKRSHLEHAGEKSPAPIRPEGRRSFLWVMAFFAFVFGCVVVWQVFHLMEAHRNTIGDGRTLASYGYDLSNLTVDRDVLVPAGLPKDGQTPIANPTMIEAGHLADETRGWNRFVVSDDTVVAVEINGEARAYPIRYLQWHEIVNDVVGGVPVAVTYNKLADSAVVFDRRVGERVLTFGYSGLVYNSHLVMYDDQPGEGSAGESLWSQLKFEAIAGPLVGTKLAVIPMHYGTWAKWLEAHPQTMVWGGEKPFREKYNKRHILPGYFARGELKFPVDPLPTDHMRDKLMFHVYSQAEAPDADTRYKAHARYFAWYAVHGNEGMTDFLPDEALRLSND